MFYITNKVFLRVSKRNFKDTLIISQEMQTLYMLQVTAILQWGQMKNPTAIWPQLVAGNSEVRLRVQF